MKKVLGLDLGSSSIGWAFVHEAENNNETTKIIDAGVRVVPLTTDEMNSFNSGQSVTTNADRRLKRSARRNLQRFKLRRAQLLNVLVENKFIASRDEIIEQGINSTHRNWKLRSLAASERVELNELATIFFMINKKRGYKSSRKTNSTEEEGTAVDSVDLSLLLKHQNKTPGQYLFEQLNSGERFVKPDFYASDLKEEIHRILEFQSQYHQDIDEVLCDRFNTSTTKAQVLNYIRKDRKLELCEVPKKRVEKREFYYSNRSQAATGRIELNILLFVLTEIKGEIDKVSGYLGEISDRSKILRSNGLTIGQYLFDKLKSNPRSPLKNKVFYRQDYIDEFDKIWAIQSEYHPQLTDDLKREIKDITIFYQRRLKSQKHLVANCEFASQIKIVPKGSREPIPLKKKVAPKSSPIFQEYRLLQSINNLKITDITTGENYPLDENSRNLIYGWLQLKEVLTSNDLLKILGLDKNQFEFNLKEIIGNRTRASFIQAINKIAVLTGHEEIKINLKQSPESIEKDFTTFLEALGIKSELIQIDAYDKEYQNQLYYKVWHLLYSAEENEHIKEELMDWTGIDANMLSVFYGMQFEVDYSNISTFAMSRLLPFLKEGSDLSEACVEHSKKDPKRAFQHSLYLTKEENANRELQNNLELLKQGELRNPVVEKVVNQVINMVNTMLDDKNLGRPDEIRIEMARDLKASNDERNKLTKVINQNKKRNEEIRKNLRTEFKSELKGGRVTANDILRYKLWLETNKISLYTGKHIKAVDLFNGTYDIEHIIPKSKYFDDSFTNKTLCERKINEDKGGDTAYTYFERKGVDQLQQFKARVEHLYQLGFSSSNTAGISKRKKEILLTSNEDIPTDFINRQLQETRYISKKATEVLFPITRSISHTIGSVTKRLRDDWGLVDVMKELNWEKYSKVEGRTKIIEGKQGQKLKRIIDWDKRNDHRHHAMDAITVALTKPEYVQMLNNLNANGNNSQSYALKNKLMDNGRVKPPIKDLKKESIGILGRILISHKSKNKVTTPNINRTVYSGGILKTTKQQDVPRGQLHKETVYSKSHFYETKWVPINAKITIEDIHNIANQRQRLAVLDRFNQYNQDAKTAFSGKNALKKNPIFLDEAKGIKIPEKLKISILKERFTIRKPIAPDLKIDKIIDVGIKRKIQERIELLGKESLANIEDNPIWLDKEKGVPIKTVAISGVSNAQALHEKRDHLGNLILDHNGKPIPNDFVSLGNNHHVAIYRDSDGNFQEEVVSFYEAVERKKQGIPVVQKDHPLGWDFVFTLKQNDMFYIPLDSQDVFDLDPCKKENHASISPRLFRVQKIATKNYEFRQHLETVVTNDIKDLTMIRIQSLPRIKGLIKCRLNHLGSIVAWNIHD